MVRHGFAAIPDDRLSATEIACTDALMAAFALFSLPSPSLLAFDKHRVAGNLGTIYAIDHMPCDTQMRERLHPVSPESVRPLCKSVFGQLQRGKALESMLFLEDSSLLALDGTEYFSSKTRHCASCLHQVHRHGSITYSHHVLGAALVHPDQRTVIPLMPEPIVTQDGTAKNAGERHAAKRFIAKLRQAPPHLTFVVTEDSLSAHAPHIETLHGHGLHAMLGVKDGEHASLFAQVQAAEQAGRVPSYERHDRAARVVPRFRFVHDGALKTSHRDVRVNCIEYWEMGEPKVQHLRWVTDRRVSQRNVSHLMRGGRARWKMANETFNTLKNQGENFAHTDGQGIQNLSVVFATVMLLACLVEQTQQLCCALFQAVWAKLGSKRLVWERMRAFFYAYRLDAMRAFFAALLYGFETSRPLLSLDSSSNGTRPLTCLLGKPLLPQRHGLRLSKARAAGLRHGSHVH